MRVLRGFPDADIVAIFDEPDTTGDVGDINAPRNAPAKSPELYVGSGAVHFHSRFNYFAVAPGFPKTVTVNHIAYAADTGTVFGAAALLKAYTAHSSKDYTLAAHGLGTLPEDAMAAVNGQEFPIGCPIQVGANGGGRRNVSLWFDATNLYIHEDVKPGVLGLPAISVTYYVAAFRPSADQAGTTLFSGLQPAAPNDIQLGHGRVWSNEVNLRESQSGDPAPFTLPTAPCGDVKNGKFRFVLLDMETFDVGPTMGKDAYNGAFWGGPQKLVGLPT